MFVWLAYNTLCALPLALTALFARALRVGASLEHLLWTLVLVRLVFPPLAAAPEPAPASSTATTIISSGEPSFGDEIVAALTRALGNQWSAQAQQVALWLFLGTLSWIVARELARAWAVERCVRRSRRAPGALEQHVAALAARLGVRSPRVLLSAEAGGPFLWSLRRPVLVIPEEDALPAPTVLAHEFAHLLRRDHWTAWLELLVAAFHFWNPLFWIARRRLRLAAELACDTWVVERFPAERRAFAAALIDTAERASRRSFVPRAVQAIGPAGTEAGEFEERLRRILAPKSARRGRRTGALCAALLALLTLPGLGAPSLDAFRRALPALPVGIDRTMWEERLERALARLASAPADGAAFDQLGLAYLGLGRLDEALAAFEKQEALGFQVHKALYNQACARTRRGELDDALYCLERAASGMPVAQLALEDPDLEPLRAHPGFAALTEP